MPTDPSEKPTHYAETKYGFDYGAAKIERAWSHKGHVGIMIHTGKKIVMVRITPSGLIRIGDVEKDWHK